MASKLSRGDVIRRLVENTTVSSTGCWEWGGKLNNSGYGTLSVAGQSGTHRVAYRMLVGEIPEGVCVCHSCDNRRCCNPEHLWLGTAFDNAQDCARKGRNGSTVHPESRPRGDDHWTRRPGVKLVGQRGEKCVNAKLTSEQVAEIRAKYASGKFYQRELAKLYGVGQTQIGRIIRGVRWAHLLTESESSTTQYES